MSAQRGAQENRTKKKKKKKGKRRRQKRVGEKFLPLRSRLTLTAKEHLAFRRLVDRSDQIQHRRLAAAGRAEYHNKLAAIYS